MSAMSFERLAASEMASLVVRPMALLSIRL